jgi:hypothetical protein
MIILNVPCHNAYIKHAEFIPAGRRNISLSEVKTVHGVME